MNCEDYQAKLAAFLNEELPILETRALEAHLSHCDACTEALVRQVSVELDTDFGDEVAASLESFDEQIQPRARLQKSPRLSSWSTGRPLIAVVAASLVFLLVLFIMEGDNEDPLSEGPELLELVRDNPDPKSYRLKRHADGGESIFICDPKVGFIQKSLDSGKVELAGSSDPSLAWQYDGHKDAVRMAKEGLKDILPNLAEGRRYVAHLMKEFEETSREQIQLGREDCWKYELRARDGRDEKYTIVIDESGLIRTKKHFVDQRLVDSVELCASPFAIGEGELDLSRLVTAATNMIIVDSGVDLESMPFEMMRDVAQGKKSGSILSKLPEGFMQSEFVHGLVMRFDTRENGSKWSKMFGVPDRDDLLSSDDAFPMGLLKPLPASHLKELGNLKKFVSVIAQRTGVSIVVKARGHTMVMAPMNLGPLPIPAFQLLNIAAMTHQLKIEVVDEKVTLLPRK